LASLESQGLAAIVVVDNGSSADEVAALRAQHGIRLLPLETNQGFAGPANLGARKVGETKAARYLVLVNNDCVLDAGYVAACAEVLDADPSLVAVQGVILDAKGERVDGCGLGWNDRGEAVQVGWGGPPPARESAVFAVAGVSGTAPVFRLDAFLDSGGFEPSFFAYYEDADLSLRLARGGGRFACVPAARARHAGSQTGRRRPELMWRRLLTNRIRTLRRNVEAKGRHASLVPAAIRSAALDIGWMKAVETALAALVEASRRRRIDAEMLAALPPLARLPR
ncbi:MAG TPA: glycosyltransferase family 2 protein, partial [Thermoanaerobaculia bacterium]|nr:glycosyltransferase family 2 protein [Thermoanaerobaculia bacterium]